MEVLSRRKGRNATATGSLYSYTCAYVCMYVGDDDIEIPRVYNSSFFLLFFFIIFISQRPLKTELSVGRFWLKAICWRTDGRIDGYMLLLLPSHWILSSFIHSVLQQSEMEMENIRPGEAKRAPFDCNLEHTHTYTRRYMDAMTE